MKPRPKPPPLSNAERCRLHRDRVKKDPERRDLLREADKERARQNRLKPKTPEEIEKIKEQNRRRQQLYYARKKARKSENTAPRRRKTRQSEEEEAKKRERNRTYVNTHRQNRTSQKKRRDNEKQLKYYYRKKEEKQAELQQDSLLQDNSQPEAGAQLNSTPYPTQSAYRKAVARVRAKIKAKGLKLAFLYKGLLKFSGRNTKQTLKELNVSFQTPEKRADIRAHVEDLRVKRDKATLSYKRRLSEAFGTQDNGFSNRYMANTTTDLYKRKKTNQTNQLVRRFYEEHSHPDPCKASRARQLLRPVRDLHQDFLRLHPDKNVSRRHFYRLKPKNVASVRKAKFRQCLCEICLNPNLKLQTLNRLMPCFRSVREMLEDSVCAFVDVPKLECVERKCRLCGTERVKEKLESALEGRLESTVGWAKWMHVKEGKSSRMDKAKKRGSVRDCVNEMIGELDSLYMHVFVAEWQRRQLSGLKADLPEGWALVTCDYAENFLCRFQDEPQSAHWAYKQVTLFPAVVFYRCSGDDCQELRREEVAFFSDDLVKDAQMSQVITDRIVDFLRDKLGAGLKKIVLASDGCAAQFKSKVPFLLFTRMRTPGFSVERVYFGSRHGKNDSDWSGGAIKRQVTRDLAAGVVCIRDAQQMFIHCRDTLSFQGAGCQDHKSRNFQFLPNITRSLQSRNVRTVPGSRKFQHLRSLGPGLMAARGLSCFCVQCQSGSYGDCMNQSHVAPWRICQIHCSAEEEAEEDEEEEVSLHEENEGDTETEMEYDEDMVVDFALSDGEEALERDERFDMNIDISEGEEDSEDFFVSEGHRLEFFSKAAATLRACGTYEDLKTKCFQLRERILLFSISSPLFAKDLPFAQDKTAADLLDTSVNGMCHPLSVPADGNCFFNAASLLLFGNVKHHTELRVRTVAEMCCSEDLFLDGSYWTSPATNLDPQEVLEVAMLTSHSPANGAAESFRSEVLSVVQNSTYTGLWEFLALSMALKMPVQSVFPPLGWQLYQRHCNRIFRAAGVTSNRKLIIFWSSLRGSAASAEHWVPNHFVPLVLSEEPARVPDIGSTYLCPWAGSLYPCTVLETDELLQLTLVQFMKKKGAGWCWADADYSWEPTSLLGREISLQLIEESSTQRCQVFKYV